MAIGSVTASAKSYHLPVRRAGGAAPAGPRTVNDAMAAARASYVAFDYAGAERLLARAVDLATTKRDLMQIKIAAENMWLPGPSERASDKLRQLEYPGAKPARAAEPGFWDGIARWFSRTFD